jgi:hypothetical protein
MHHLNTFSLLQQVFFANDIPSIAAGSPNRDSRQGIIAPEGMRDGSAIQLSKQFHRVNGERHA